MARSNTKHPLGCLALVFVILALVLPAAVFFRLCGLHRDDIGWEEGGALVALMICLAGVIVGQTLGLTLASHSRSTVPGRIARMGAIGLLALAGASFVFLVLVIFR